MPLGVVVVGYVLASTVWPSLLVGADGVVVAFAPVTAKLLTMTALLVCALRFDTGSRPGLQPRPVGRHR
jgi:hypothetical protein